MTQPASDELIAMLEQKMAPLDKFATVALIARIRQQDETIKRMDEALEILSRVTQRPAAYIGDVETIARAARKEPT